MAQHRQGALQTPKLRTQYVTPSSLAEPSSVVVREQAYEAGTVLHELITEHPQMLAGDYAELAISG